MAEKCRSLNFFLLICALASGLLFYGCGGGTSSDPLPITMLQITGNVTSSVQLANMVDDNGLLPDIKASFTTSNIEVYLESNRAQFSTRTDSAGNYILSGVPAGTHYIIALFTTFDNKVYKVRSGPVSVSDKDRVAQVAALPLAEATATVSGRIIDASGNPVANARLTLWGENFYTDATGLFTTPQLPIGSTPQEIIVNIPGFQSTTIAIEFSANTPFVEQMVVGTAATNRPPVTALKANRYSVSANGQVTLTATASDPENDTLNYSWSASAGTISNSANNLSRTWTAPDSSTVATLTFTATDSAGLRSASSVLITVGAGQVGQNAAPVVLEFNANSATFLANTDYQLTVIATDSNNDTLYYTWTASQGSIIAPNTTSTVVWKTPAVTSLTNVQVTVKVDDKKGGVVFEPRTFQVSNDPNQPANQPPVVTIVSPANNSLHLPGIISYSGQATDPEETTVSETKLRWLEAKPGSSAELVADKRATFSKNIYLPGTYTLTLQARDSLDAVGSQTIQFRINATPTVSIASPVAGTYNIGSSVIFNASGNDTEDGALAANRFTWLFPAPVGVQTGNNLPINNLPMGVNTISVSAKDSLGANSATATIQITIANTGPTMNIISPTEGSVIPVHQLTTISGDGTGFNSQVIDPTTFKWEYRQFADTGSTTLATGVDSVVASFTKLGLHTLTLTGIDSANVSSITRRLFYVNATPSVQITSPASGIRADLDAPIVFAAAVSDPDATDSPLAVRWYRDNGATALQFGTGTTYLSQAGDLPAGIRQIGCEVVDSHGVASYSMINVLINTLPVGTFTYSTTQYATAPGNLPVFISANAEMNITLTMTTDDAEDGELPDAPATNIQWFTPDNMVPFAYGKTVTQNFPLGAATVTVRIYDSFSPAFMDQASATYSIGFHVWQRKSFSIPTNDVVYIHGANNKLYITRSAGANHGVDEYEFIEGLSPIISQISYYDMVATAAFTAAYAGSIYDNRVAVLGNKAGVTICDFEELGTPTAMIPFAEMAGSTCVAFHPTDKTYGYLSRANRLTTFNPLVPSFENDITTVEGLAFAAQNRVRFVSGSPSYQGSVFATDTSNNRVIRFLDASCSNPRTLVASTPIDVAFTTNYAMTLSSGSRKVSLHSITADGSNWLMDFGGAGPAAGAFTNPTGMYCSGKDLFVLDGTNTIHLIRSGENDWLKP